MVNPYDTSRAQIRKTARMQEEFAALGVETRVVRNDGLAVYVCDGRIKCNINEDFVLYFDKERIIASMLEKAGIRLFNRAEATEICDDKMLTHAVLADSGILMPDTIAGPLCYCADARVDSDSYMRKIVDRLGLPVVVKECHGSFGEQVYLCDSISQLRDKLEEIKGKPHLLQRYEAGSRGSDMRVIVIGGKAVCAMRRINAHDFRSNVALGGKGESTAIPRDIEIMCEKAASIIGLDYCGVDVLLTDPPKLCEVNSNAMFEEMESVTQFNVARAYALHIVNSVAANDKSR